MPIASTDSPSLHHRPRTRRSTTTCLVVGGLMACLFAFTGCGNDAARLTGQQARSMHERGATLLDVRSESEWSRGHLEGAVHISIDTLSARMGELPREEPVIVYCASGGRSAQGTALLRSAGFDAHDLGGMNRYGE